MCSIPMCRQHTSHGGSDAQSAARCCDQWPCVTAKGSLHPAARSGLFWALLALRLSLTLGDEVGPEKADPVHLRKTFLALHGRRAKECVWRCQQNGAKCNPDGGASCDCVAQGCSNPDVAYVEAGSGTGSSTVFIIPLIAGFGLCTCCCVGVAYRDVLLGKAPEDKPKRKENTGWLGTSAPAFSSGTSQNRFGITTTCQQCSPGKPHRHGATCSCATYLESSKNDIGYDTGTWKHHAANHKHEEASHPKVNSRSGSRNPSPAPSLQNQSRSPSLSPSHSRKPSPKPTPKITPQTTPNQSRSPSHSPSPSRKTSPKTSAKTSPKGTPTTSAKTSPRSQRKQRSRNLRAAADKVGEEDYAYDVADLFVSRVAQKLESSQKRAAPSDTSTAIGSMTTISRDVLSSLASSHPVQAATLAEAADASRDAQLSTAGEQRLVAMLQSMDAALGVAATSPRISTK